MFFFFSIRFTYCVYFCRIYLLLLQMGAIDERLYTEETSLIVLWNLLSLIIYARWCNYFLIAVSFTFFFLYFHIKINNNHVLLDYILYSLIDSWGNNRAIVMWLEAILFKAENTLLYPYVRDLNGGAPLLPTSRQIALWCKIKSCYTLLRLVKKSE